MAAIAIAMTIVTFIIATLIIFLSIVNESNLPVLEPVEYNIFTIIALTFIINLLVFITLILCSFHQKEQVIKLQNCITLMLLNIPISALYIIIIFI